jgi:hypothetical protein
MDGHTYRWTGRKKMDIWAGRRIDRQTDRQTDRLIYRWTDEQAEGYTGGETYRWTGTAMDKQREG